MKLYDEPAHGFRAIAYELPTLEKAYRQRDKLRKKGYSITDTPRAFDEPNGARVYIVYAKKRQIKINKTNRGTHKPARRNP